jgi:alkylation response protein AidB-like acyl-CoA dehydrogenase
MTDLLYSDVEEDLRSSVRSLLADRSPWSHVLKRAETSETYDLELWRTLATEMGLAGLLIPESLGGAGASAREAAVVLEELGHAVAPVPFLGSAIVATTALLHCADSNRADSNRGDSNRGDTELLRLLASGERTAALAVPFSVRTAGGFSATADGDRLSGRITSVADALPADLLLVPTADGLFAVDAVGDGVTVTPVVSLDLTRQLADVTLDGATGRRVAEGAAALAAVDAALLAGSALLASEQVGVAVWCVESTVEYLKTRYQFGRLIGSYQALKHRAADMWVDATQARAVARYAADCLATGSDDLPVAAAVAQAFVGPIAVRLAEEAVQLHGGIGFTWEYPIHLYLKRAKSDSLAYGSAAVNRTALAELVNLPTPKG